MIEKKLTMKNAILAKCWDCMGYYTDGKKDCRNYHCPLYNWMPVAEYEPLTDWLEYNPKRVGHVSWKECQRVMTDEQKAAAAARLKKMRKKAEKLRRLEEKKRRKKK